MEARANDYPQEYLQQQLRQGASNEGANNNNYVYEQQEDIRAAIDPNPLDSSGLMTLGAEERQWAQQIKEAIEMEPEMDSLSDFEYAQLALVEMDQTRTAVERARHMQQFREEYNVRNTLEDAAKVVWDYLNLFENHILSFSFSQDHGCYICIIDMAAFSLCVTEEEWQINLGGFYYIHQAMNPDIASIEKGICMVFECQGFELKALGGLNTIRRTCDDMVDPYPTNIFKLKFFHTGVMWNVFLSLCKPFLSQDRVNKHEIGCKFPDRLDQFYLVPDAKTAQKRNYCNIMDCLRRRFENEKKFKL